MKATRGTLALFLAIAVLSFMSAANAQARRIALVIGNSAYKKTASPTPVTMPTTCPPL